MELQLRLEETKARKAEAAVNLLSHNSIALTSVTSAQHFELTKAEKYVLRFREANFDISFWSLSDYLVSCLGLWSGEAF